MPAEFWGILTALAKQYGLFGTIFAAQLVLISHYVKKVEAKDKEIKELREKNEEETKEFQEKLLELSEKRLQDAREERDEYEELTQRLDKSLDLIVKAFRKRG